jgi:hypothetical protein
MGLTGRVISQDALAASSTQEDSLGAIARTSDGRQFRYVQAGATTLVAGTVAQSPAVAAGHLNLTVNTTLNTAGVKTIQGVSFQTAVNASYFAGGLMITSNGGGAGYAYKVSSHAAGNSTVNASVVLVSGETLQVAANSTTRVGFIANKYKGVVIQPTTITGTVVGVVIYPIPNAQFGYVQTHGPAAVLQEGTVAAGLAVGISANVAGAVAVPSVAAQAANTATSVTVIGRNCSTAVDAKYTLVDLCIE